MQRFGFLITFLDLEQCFPHLFDYAHGRPQKFFQGATSTFGYPFQVADNAMQMDVHKTLCPFKAAKEIPRVTATVTKMCFVGTAAIARYITIIYTIGYLQIFSFANQGTFQKSIGMVFKRNHKLGL